MSFSTVLVSKSDLVTLALSELGGSQQSVDTEDVAVKARDLSAFAFAWRRYPQHINLELVRVALVDAGRAGLVQGKGRGGWVLTDEGVDWVTANRARLLKALGKVDEPGSARVKRPESAHRERERIRIGRSTAWERWGSGQPVSPIEASAVFRVDQYTTEANRITKVRSIRELFEDDPDLRQFLEAMSVLIATGIRPRGGIDE